MLKWLFLCILMVGEYHMKYYERLTISIVTFLGVTIGTIGMIEVYFKTTRNNNEPKQPTNTTSIILENINIIK